jgi:hypothetical protein
LLFIFSVKITIEFLLEQLILMGVFPDPKIGDNNQPNEKPTTPDFYRETPVHMQSGPPYYEKRQENDPFDQGFWHKVPVTEATPFFGNPLSPDTFFHQKFLEAGVSSNQDPHYSGTLETPVPAVIFKEIDCKPPN